MIESINWNRYNRIGELSSPFLNGKGERPLRITFHTESLVEISAEEMAAVRTLRELARLPEIEALETQPGAFPHIVMGAFDANVKHIPLEVSYPDRRVSSGILFPRQWLQTAENLAWSLARNSTHVPAILQDLLIAQAHISLHGDILVTLSPLILEHSKKYTFEANPRTPTEAAQILGLFLRSRNLYPCSTGPFRRCNLDHTGFYWVLARHRLPSMWRYFSACLEAEKLRGDDFGYLGQSILTRAVRALEARDAIGYQFYIPQDNATRDQMMYHFDYLTLVLSGALDAEARVAHRAYNVAGEERDASFRRQEFRKRLLASGAKSLHDLITGQDFLDMATLLYEPRNTIHAAALPTFGKVRSSSEASLVSLPASMASKLWEAAERLGGAARWGLTRGVSAVHFEPYSYASALVSEGLRAVDLVAAATEVEKLFPPRRLIPALLNASPEEFPFDQSTREQIGILG